MRLQSSSDRGDSTGPRSYPRPRASADQLSARGKLRTIQSPDGSGRRRKTVRTRDGLAKRLPPVCRFAAVIVSLVVLGVGGWLVYSRSKSTAAISGKTR